MPTVEKRLSSTIYSRFDTTVVIRLRSQHFVNVPSNFHISFWSFWLLIAAKTLTLSMTILFFVFNHITHHQLLEWYFYPLDFSLRYGQSFRMFVGWHVKHLWFLVSWLFTEFINIIAKSRHARHSKKTVLIKIVCFMNFIFRFISYAPCCWTPTITFLPD